MFGIYFKKRIKMSRVSVYRPFNKSMSQVNGIILQNIILYIHMILYSRYPINGTVSSKSKNHFLKPKQRIFSSQTQWTGLRELYLRDAEDLVGVSFYFKAYQHM